MYSLLFSHKLRFFSFSLFKIIVNFIISQLWTKQNIFLLISEFYRLNNESVYQAKIVRLMIMKSSVAALLKTYSYPKINRQTGRLD